jgi:hypothetical protein
MEARDLRAGPPRRWNDTLDGVPWLPRLIDKARAVDAGTLGTYLYGQSPTDHSLLRALGLNHRRFLELVGSCADDAAVLAALAARDPQAIPRAREWGADLGRQHGWFFFILDIDDGYAPALRPLRRVVTASTDALTWTVKRVWPSRAKAAK